MRQNHPETSLIPSHIAPKHIPKLFFPADFSPQIPKKRLSPQTPGTMRLPALQNCQNLHGTIFCNPKTRLWGPLRATKCLDAWYSVPRHHTITMGPYLGFPRATGIIQLVKFSPFCSQTCLAKLPKPSTGPFCATPKPVRRGPCGQPSAWMPPTVSQDTTQSLWDPTLRSPGHPGYC